MCAQYLYSFISAFVHIESTDKDHHLTEAKEPGAEFSQEQQHEPEQYEGADQGQAYDYYDYTNSSNLPGKHRSILTQSLISVKSLLIYLCIKLIGIDLIPSCMR